jgi:hypothetical protein
MPRRDEGTIRRATVDLRNLYIEKSSKKQKKPKELPTSHLGSSFDLRSDSLSFATGPGTYFHPSEEHLPVSNPSIDLTATAKKSQWTLTASRSQPNLTETDQRPLSGPTSTSSTQQGKSKYYDLDPMLPVRPVFTIGQRRPDGAQISGGSRFLSASTDLPISDPSPPGPGSYFPDRSLFGGELLKEGGGAVTRPGKLCSTSSSEGMIPGQHAPAIYSLPVSKSASKLISRVTVRGSDGSVGHSHTVTAHWKPSPYLHSSQENAMKAALRSVKRGQNIGRGTESSVQNREQVFRGRNSTGSYLRTNAPL